MEWTDNEKRILRNNYYLLTAAELAKLLPNRTRSAIVSKVLYLKRRGHVFKRPKGWKRD